MSQQAEPSEPPQSLDAPLTPKIHNKRRTLSVSEGNSFDCQSLQRSLKRVRLTSNITPGELRLQRDLRHAVLNHQWIPISDDEWRIPFYRRRVEEEGDEEDQFILRLPLPMEEYPNSISVTLTRDEQDPMELILCIEVSAHIPMAGSAVGTSASTSIMHLQFPRMYPHRPPLVLRIDYHEVPLTMNNPKRWVAGSTTSNSSGGSIGSGSIATQSPCAEPTSLLRIVIAASPDDATKAQAVEMNGTVLLTDWTPVSRLTDICEWLVDTALVYHHQFPAAADRIGTTGSGLSTPTTCNCSTLLRARVSSEEKKEDDRPGESPWPSNNQTPRTFWKDRNCGDESPGGASLSLKCLPQSRFDSGCERLGDIPSYDKQSRRDMDQSN